MFVIYLATCALLLGLVVVVLFASFERRRTGPGSQGSADPASHAGAGPGPGGADEADAAEAAGEIERVTAGLVEALGLSVESTETDEAGTFRVCSSSAEVVGGRYVFLSAARLRPEGLNRLRDRVRAESALKGVAVTAAGDHPDGGGQVVLDDVVLERLTLAEAQDLIDRLTEGGSARSPIAPSPPAGDPCGPAQSADHDDGPGETRK